MTTRRCCKPADYDEFRTHQVRYSQVSLIDGRIEFEDGGEESAGSHNDAIAQAEMMAGRFDVCMKPRGRHGTWMGSEVIEGDGERASVWISRGPAEEEYDRQWAAEIERHNAEVARSLA